MPLKDSFSRPSPDSDARIPHAHKPDKLPRPPTKEDLEFTLQRARDKPQNPFGLQWVHGDQSFVLSITADQGKAPPAWLLQTGSSAADKVVAWSYRSYDVSQILNFIEAAMQNEPPVIEAAPEEIFPFADDEPANSLVGTKFADQYIIIDTIGGGGMGMVYKARDLQADRFVAVKVLHKRLLSEANSKKRFEQEARAAMSLAHPNLISVYHYGFYETTIPFLVMEYIDGQGLDEKLKAVGQLDLEECLDLFIQCCDGLTHAHQKKIIHRDLKPINVMLLKGDSKQIKIVDFGISKILALELSRQDLTREDQLIGSPYYMSPEQCKGEKIDARSDIYSLGCLMYHAVTGVVPFAGENALQTMGKHICETPSPPMAVRPDLHIPVKLQNCILTTLEKEPDNRYASLQELRTELQEILDEVRGPERVKELAPGPSHLLVDTGDLPMSTYEAALKVQSLLRSGALTLTQAAQALDRAHLQGGKIDIEGLSGGSSEQLKGIEAPVEAILVEAGLIKNDVWKTVLQLQQQMRNGQLSKQGAIEEFRRQHPKAVLARTGAKKAVAPQVPRDILELMISAGIITNQEVSAAAATHGEEGTHLAKRLVAMGKLDDDTLIAARQCLSLIEHKGLAVERAVIALVYRQRSRVNLYEVFDELGWERPW